MQYREGNFLNIAAAPSQRGKGGASCDSLEVRNMHQKHWKAAAAAILLTVSLLPAAALHAGAADIRRFDLGGNAQNGWTSVSASDGYRSDKGWGFSGNGVKNVGASGKNELSDAVQFTDGKTTLDIDLPEGLYRVKVTLGNTSRTSVFMENRMQIVNMTGNNAVDEILIPVTDGRLNIRAGAGKDKTAFSISALEIEKVSDSPVLPPTIWICGDSTVCNYYPLDTSVQGGWGQMLGHYVDKGWNIRNMAASGQYAKGFLDAGQFAPIEDYGKPGDVYIISIGINDSKYYKGAEYQKYITDMTRRAKKKGMEVILVKQQGRNGDAQNNPPLKSRWFAAELDNVAKQENVQVVDLFRLWLDYCTKIGPDKTTQLYMNGDKLHPNRAGAEKLAELFATQFRAEPGTAPQPPEPVTEEPTEAPAQPTGELIRELRIYDTANAAGWSVSAGLQAGDLVFGDRAFRLTAVPEVLREAEVLHTACDSKRFGGDQASFTAAEDVTVYLCADDRLTPPEWLSAWTMTGETLTDDGNPEVTYLVYRKDYRAGETVTIGVNGDNNTVNYIAAVKRYEASVMPTEPTGELLTGDIDADGMLAVSDVIMLQKWLLGSGSLKDAASADLNADGEVDIFDLACLKRQLLTR